MKMTSKTTLAIGILASLALSTSCKGNSKSADDQVAPTDNAASEPAPQAIEDSKDSRYRGKVAKKPASAPAHAGDVGTRMMAGEAGAASPVMVESEEEDMDGQGIGYGSGSGKDGEATGVRSRAWFPETFLFDPLVVTDAQGRGQVKVTVPDRLTTWRVLALAHSRSGSQAGATTEFLGTLPAYVDPVLPPRLRVGDKIRIPVQIVNTTDKDLRTDLTMSADGAELSAPPRSVSVPARGRTILMATITARTPGTIRLAATLGGTDAVVRTAEVIPTGRRIDVQRQGTLAAPRTLKITGPTGGSDRARLDVFPGALAIVRSELAAAGGRGGLAQNAFALLLAGQAPELLAKFGDTLDEEGTDKLRTMTILATQRTVRMARTLNEDSATLLARATLAHPENSLLTGIGERAVAYLQTNQLPDGSCGGQNGWTLQRLLVATADCARAAKDAPIVLARASGLFERNAAQIRDPYTAAAVLVAFSSANRTPDLAMVGKLRKVVSLRPSASRSMVRDISSSPMVLFGPTAAGPVESKPVRWRHSALKPDPDSVAMVCRPRRDCALRVLTFSSGFGDGRASLVAMEALVSLFEAGVAQEGRDFAAS